MVVGVKAEFGWRVRGTSPYRSMLNWRTPHHRPTSPEVTGGGKVVRGWGPGVGLDYGIGLEVGVGLGFESAFSAGLVFVFEWEFWVSFRVGS